MRGGNGVALMGRFFTSMLFFLEIRLTFCAYETRLRFMIDLDIQKQFEQERSTHDSSSDKTKNHQSQVINSISEISEVVEISLYHPSREIASMHV